MITQKNNTSNLKVSWPFIALSVLGTILNLVAIITNDNGALVAVGCSLIAIGASLNVAISKRKHDR